MRFKNKVALITGSSRGLGKEMALEFAREGAAVAVNYFKSSEEATKVTDTIKSMDCNAIKVQADVSDIDQVDRMTEMVLNQLGRIDFLVNNAGVNIDVRVRNMDQKSWNKVLLTNLSGTFNCTRSVIEHMIGRGSGRIVNISSIVGQMGSIGASNYAAAKSGVIGFTKSMALEVATSGITVNAVALGYIDAGMTRRLSPEMQANLLSRIPMKRFGQPGELARTVVFLCTEDAGYITGQTININGGLYT